MSEKIERYYRSLYQFNVSHDYYESGVCSDFEFRPTEATQKVLRQYGLILKNTKAGFNLVYCAIDEAGTPKIEIDEKIVLQFRIQLNTPELHKLTNFPDKTSSDFFVLRGAYDDAGLVLEAMTKSTPRFDCSFSNVASDVRIKIENDSSEEFFNQTFQGEVLPDDLGTNQFNISCQLNGGMEDGMYTISKIFSGITEEVERYISNNPQDLGGFGMLLLELNSDIDYTLSSDDVTTPIYQSELALTATTSLWSYHLLLNRDYSGRELSISVDATTDEDSPYFIEEDDVEGLLEFNLSEEAPEATEGSELVFVASREVPFYEKPKTGITLTIAGVVDSDDSDEIDDAIPELVLTDLANPSTDAPDSTIYISL